MNLFSSISRHLAFYVTLAFTYSAPAYSADMDLPDPTSGAFCQQVQKVLAGTAMSGEITVFDNMPDYRHSKPAPEPLQIFQVVTYNGKLPIVVSCKVKAADHIRAVYGENAAGEQKRCSVITKQALRQAMRELDAENLTDAIARASTFIVDDNEPFMTGQSYLQDFEISYADPESNVHLQSPGLQTNWDNLLLWIMPNRVRGQTYCHLPTVAYIKALATGTIEPGTVITTADDAPTKPQN